MNLRITLTHDDLRRIVVEHIRQKYNVVMSNWPDFYDEDSEIVKVTADVSHYVE